MFAVATEFLIRWCGVGMRFRKSWHSNPNGECVEVGKARRGSVVRVRDTRDRRGPQLRFSPETWQAFVRDTKSS